MITAAAVAMARPKPPRRPAQPAPQSRSRMRSARAPANPANSRIILFHFGSWGTLYRVCCVRGGQAYVKGIVGTLVSGIR